MLSTRIGSSFLAKLFAAPIPGAFQFPNFWRAMAATNSTFIPSNCLLVTVRLPHTMEMKYESSCCPPIWRSGSAEI